jgi:UDP-N-acetylmuramoyl-tripeptide--D-alanyl-D-alanine ligase
MQFNGQFITSVIKEAVISGSNWERITSVSIDSRTVRPGALFVAIQGARQDGHDFLKQACERGAVSVMIAASQEQALKTLSAQERASLITIIVSDPAFVLIELARAWRAQFDYPVVAVTGSVGKTSTKQFLGAMLTAAGKRCLVSEGNFNTMIGASLTLLSMHTDYDVAVVEVGINKRGEMAQLAQLVRPTNAIITNIGHSHMEGLGSLSDIAAEKRSIFSCFTERNIGAVNGDQASLAGVSYSHPVVKFGIKTTNQVQARKIVFESDFARFDLKIYGAKYRVAVPNPHLGTIMNILAAASMAHLLGASDEQILTVIGKPPIVAGRFEFKKVKAGRGALINDCYNANPESMKAALLAFQKLSTHGAKIAVLGDMLELGHNSPFWHRQLGRFLRKVPSLGHLILVGTTVEWTKKTLPFGISCEVARDWQEAIVKLEERLDAQSLVLVKGSNGIQLGKLVDHFCD